MRGESLEPGGCSVWPTSAWAIATICAPTPVPLAATGAAAVVAPAAVAWPSMPAKLAADAVGDGAVAAVEEEVVAAGAATLGWSIAWISAMRARATSRLTSRVVGRAGQIWNSRRAAPQGPPR